MRAAKGLPFPETQHKNVIVGMSSTEPGVKEEGGARYEIVDPKALTPANIFEAQLALRKKGK